MRKFLLLFISQMCSVLCFTQVIINPIYDRTDFELYHPHVDKVELKKDSTKVYCSINFQESCSYGISKTMYIEDIENNRKYQVTKCIGIPFLPEEKLFDGRTIQIVFCFPHIENLHQFNLIEDSLNEKFFNIYGIDITKCYSKSFEESEYKRFKNMSDFYKSSNNIDKFVEYKEQELLAAQYIFGIKSLSIADIYKQMAFSYSLINDNNNAIKYCNKALDIIENNGYNNSEYNAELLGLKCKYQQRSRLKDEAIASGTAAKQLYDSLDIKSLTYAELLDDLAWAYSSDLNYERSIQLQKIAAGIYEKAEDWISLAEAYQNIGRYYQYAVNLDDAERNIKKSIDVLNEHDIYQVNSKNDAFINQRINTAKISNHVTLARIYQEKGDYINAINIESKNGMIIKSMGDDQLYAIHLRTLSEYYMGNHQYSNALICAKNSIDLIMDDNKTNPAPFKSQLAIIYFLTGDTIKAIHYAEESVSASKSFNDKKGIISTLSILSSLYFKKHEYEKAEQYLSEELDYLKSFISDELIGKTIEQKQRLWGEYEYDFLQYRRIIEKSNREDVHLSKLYDYVLFSKSLLLDADIQNNVNSLKITWKDIQQQLSDEDIAIEFMLTFEKDGNITYHALIIDKNNPNPRMITLYSETELEDIQKTDIRDFREIVGELIWRPIKAQYGNVRNIYFSPDGILHLIPFEYYGVDSTANMYEHYNIYRLSSTKELVKEHRNRQTHSAVLYGGLDYNHLAEANAKMDTNEIASVWRGIAERGGFDPLFNTIAESQEIKDILEANNIFTTLYTGEEGTEESFRNLSNQNHSIIHLATHGMYVNPHNIEAKKTENNFEFLESLTNKNDPVKEDVFLTHSFLVMAGGNRLITRDSVSDSNSDGILTSKEISQLNLGGLDLVVLSACETALGDMGGDGVYGLQRAFKKAGANAILMSLGKVDDEATKILMVEFYKNLMGGKSKRQSLKDAQRYLRQVDNGKYDAPEYWASFILLDGLD